MTRSLFMPACIIVLMACSSAGVPMVDYGGQGGRADVVLHSQFADNGFLYLICTKKDGGNTRGAVPAGAYLTPDDHGGGTFRARQPQCLNEA